ncbi:MAG TPA: HNH endonuclease signature motif containing protein [Vicinamibacteria bacterium]|nr:HNH endonuclease signature motif containing protein [Vicinamibacteria bacterium]
MKMTDVRMMDDGSLVGALTNLAGREREATVALILHLAEFDARRLYRGAGFPSLFQYCVIVLRLSEDAAANRIAAVRMARRFPAIVEMLLEGRLSPTTVRLIAAHATPENCAELVVMADGKTRRQVEEELARRFPSADVRPSIRPLGPAIPSVTRSGISTATPSIGDAELKAEASRPEPAPTAAPPPLVAPATGALVQSAADRYELRFAVNADTLDKLKMAQDLLSHAVPNGDLSQVFDRALDALVEDLLRRRFAVTDGPKSDGTSAGREPAAVRRRVYLRDRGRCTYVAPDGRRCDSRRFLQFDHIRLRADGGEFTVDNIRLRCGPHNRLEAERVLGSAPSPPRWTVIRPGTDGARRRPAVATTPHVGPAAG